VTERPILCSDSVALAIREGRQTQHRVPMRPQPVIGDDGVWYPAAPRKPAHQSRHYANEEHFRRGVALDFAPWQPGDVLYVRECWRTTELVNGLDGFRYRADGAFWPIANTKEAADRWLAVHRASGAWRPSIHMPKLAARTWTGPVARTWIERVQDISEEDARAEGIRPLTGQAGQPGCWYTGNVAADPPLHARSAREAYRRLIEALYPGIWESNVWLWCCAFELDRERPGVL